LGKSGYQSSGAVAGDDHAAGAVALADELVEILRLGGRELTHAEVVEDEHVGLQVGAQPWFPGAVGTATGEVAQEGDYSEMVGGRRA